MELEPQPRHPIFAAAATAPPRSFSYEDADEDEERATLLGQRSQQDYLFQSSTSSSGSGGAYDTFGTGALPPSVHSIGTADSSTKSKRSSILHGLMDGELGPKAIWNAFLTVFNKEKLSFSLWPHFYTAACLAVYGMPAITLAHLARVPSVNYWIGPDGYYAPLIPAGILLLHVVHERIGKPRLIPVIFSSVVPALILFAMANKHLLETKAQAGMLLSKDCRTFPLKGDVHRSWVIATQVFSGCINRTARQLERPAADVYKITRFQECLEWTPRQDDPWAEHRRAWAYLRSLEEDHACSGWCWPAPATWAYGPVKDACSVSAGAELLEKIYPVTIRLLIFSAIAGTISVLGILRFERKFPEAAF